MDDKILELGCICFNAYIDRKLFNNQILELCDDISLINSEIIKGLNDSELCDEQGAFEPHDETEENTEENNDIKVDVDKSTVANKTEEDYPYKMEVIPANFKRCRCGYRNRPEAVFCGKCGSKLA